MKSLLLLLVAVAAGVGVWLVREPAQLARLTNSFRQSVAPTATATAPGGSARPNSPMRKCKRGDEVLYTNDKCPAGSREEGVQGGSLTVLPAAPVAAPASQPAMDLQSMKEKRIDKIIGH